MNAELIEDSLFRSILLRFGEAVMGRANHFAAAQDTTTNRSNWL